MSTKRYFEARDYILGTHYQWVKKFNIDEYIDNAPMIEKAREGEATNGAHSVDNYSCCGALQRGSACGTEPSDAFDHRLPDSAPGQEMKWCGRATSVGLLLNTRRNRP